MVDVSVVPLVVDFKPYLDVFVDAVITAGVGVVAFYVQRYTGYQVTALQQKELAAKVESLAGAEVAKASGNIATDVIHINDPRVASIANAAIQALPKVAANLGVTASSLAADAQGALGKLQASMTGVSPAPVAVPVVVTEAKALEVQK